MSARVGPLPPSAAQVQEVNAQRAAFHRQLAETQQAELAQLLAAPAQLGEPSSAPGAALAAALRCFVATHGHLLGSLPFLKGLHALLTAQRRSAQPLAWRLRPEAITQAGGVAFTRDAVALLRAHLVRRTELELSHEFLVWAVPGLRSDADLDAACAGLTAQAGSFQEVNATGELVPDTSPTAQPRTTAPPADEEQEAPAFCGCFPRASLSLLRT